MKQLVAAFLLVFTFSDGFTAEGPAQLVPGVEHNGSDCIWIRSVRDYTALDDQHLLVRGSSKRTYLVTLLHRSFEMQSSIGLGFSSRDDQLCPYGGDAVVLDGLSREAVRIRSISAVSPEQAEQLKVRFGKKVPDEQQAPAPRPVKGAEVEELD